MSAPNGMAEAIADYVRQYPACSGRDIFDALSDGAPRHHSLRRAIEAELVFGAGPVANRRYFADRFAALAADDTLRRQHAAQVAASRKAKAARHRKTQNQRRKAERAARQRCAAPTPLRTMSAPAVCVEGLTLAPGCKIVRAAPLQDPRYAVPQNFVGQITQDWLASRKETA